MRRLVAWWLVIAWLVAGCGLIAEATPEPPRPCGEMYGARRCLAMTDAAASEVGRTRDDVTAVVIVPYPPPRDGILETLGGARPIKVRLTFTDGSTIDASMCGGAPSGPACMDEPRLQAATAFIPGSGYRDLPCTGTTEDTCATPLPALDPAAVADARPLSIARLDIPIDHKGSYEIPLGDARIPNGVITSASFQFVDDWPDDITITGANVGIAIHSLEPDGKPFDGYYQHGWRPGVESIEATLVFGVDRFEPGAVLSIRDIEVH